MPQTPAAPPPAPAGLMALMLLAAIAVPVYFRGVAHAEGPWRTVIAPFTAAALLAVAIFLVVSKVGLFTMASATVNTVLIALVPAVFLAGLALAQRLKTRRPEVYARFAAEPAPAEHVEHVEHEEGEESQ
ncbi:hypothetical protein [Streptomyces sp. ISL-94]|uniref:hypothetical protein n=1 Tax=Streptomyces sp. ISL-94 TaxID=2819190 RepID=UPI001BE91852|nr:hypothetical protein [Streptomyces sp. ISL-94]